LSGNRNFEGRISPHIKANYLESPPLVVAYALAGHMNFDLYKDSTKFNKYMDDELIKPLGEAETLPGGVSELLVQYAIPTSVATKITSGAKQWQQIKKLQKKNLTMKSGVECEYFLISQDGNSIADPRDTQSKPCYDQSALMRRYDLIKEELEELKIAMENKDLLEVADALTDILYVTYGAGHAFGIDLDKCFEEVQNSNMSKLGEDGKPIYNEAGKVMKGPKYFKPDLSKFIN